jgi:hypothetical protein
MDGDAKKERCSEVDAAFSVVLSVLDSPRLYSTLYSVFYHDTYNHLLLVRYIVALRMNLIV